MAEYTPSEEAMREAWRRGAMYALTDDLGDEMFAGWRAAHDAALLNAVADEIDLPGSQATGYYASEQHAGYQDAERDIEAWLRARAAQCLNPKEDTPS